MEFLKKNKVSSVLLIMGLLILIIALSVNSGEVMSSGIRLMRYLSLILISLSLFLFFSNAKKVFLGNIALFALLLFIVEIACFFSLGMPEAENKNFDLVGLSDDHISTHIGSVPYADSTYHKVLINGTDTVYDVHPTIGKSSVRVTPDHSAENDKYALFFGCSITYGLGLEDNQTFPYHFQTNSEKYNAYNYAFEGYGTNHMLARLQYEDLSENVMESQGVAFYVFFWDHIYRAIGSMERYCGWVSSSPYYTMGDEGLERQRTFKDGRPGLSTIYEWIYQTNIIKKFDIGFPTQLGDHHFDLVSEMILESKKTYESQFGNDDFYVVFYPNFKEYTEDQLDQFKSFLDAKEIDYIDLSNIIEYSKEHTLGGDPHPNSQTNKLISEELLNRIEK